MRYFIEFAYNGTRFSGYQIQLNGYTVQECVQNALGVLLKQPTPIVGCGRTDAGVHAKQYFAHFDSEQELGEKMVYHLNAILGKEVVIYNLHKVPPTAHARFDASSRSYEYYVDVVYNPLRQESAYFCTYSQQLNIDLMQAAAKLLLDFQDFNTFCKTKSSAKTTLCDLRVSEWHYDAKEQQLVYRVTANRFLRGMIRLIVGMCLNVGKGRIELETIRQALEQKQPLQKALSAPAQGLYLMDIEYPYIEPQPILFDQLL